MDATDVPAARLKRSAAILVHGTHVLVGRLVHPWMSRHP